MTTCAICTRPVGDNAYICQEDTLRLERSLGDVRWIDTELDVVLARQTATGERVGGVSVEKPLPYDPRATEARWVLANTVTTWARIISEENTPKSQPIGPIHHGLRCGHVSCDEIYIGWEAHRQAQIPSVGGIGITAAWIASWSGWLRHHAAAEDAWDELGSAIADARRLIDTRPERVYAGPCGGLDDVECGRDLYALKDAIDITCPTCTRKYDIRDRRAELLDAARDYLATAKEISGFLTPMFDSEVTTAMIRGYQRRDRIAMKGSNVDGVAMFKIGDVIDAATKARYDDREHRATKKAGRVA